MKNIFRFVLLAGLVILTGACTSVPAQRPEDFSLVVDWNTGALPPQYYYSYSISISPQGTGDFFFQAGYEENTDNEWRTSFALTDSQMDDLYNYLAAQDMLRSDWKEGQILLGGRGTGMRISANGKEYLVPSVSELEQDDREAVNAVIDYVNDLVPQEIWNEMENRQSDYEAGFEE